MDTSRLTIYATDTTILEEALQTKPKENLFGEVSVGDREHSTTVVSTLGSGSKQSAENTIIAGLLDFPLIDYEEQKEILLSLA